MNAAYFNVVMKNTGESHITKLKLEKIKNDKGFQELVLGL